MTYDRVAKLTKQFVAKLVANLHAKLANLHAKLSNALLKISDP